VSASRSVRARVALAVGGIAAAALTTAAIAVPGIVRSSLESDLVQTEAEAAWEPIAFSSLDFDDAFFDEIATIDVVPFEDGIVVEIPVDEISDAKLAEPFIDPVSEIAITVDTLRAADLLDDVFDASGGEFAVAYNLDTVAIANPDGSLRLSDRDVFEVGAPIASLDELQGLLFDDLGLVALDDKTFIDPTDDDRSVIIRSHTLTDVESFDGERSGDVALIVAADTTGIDQSIDGFRTLLWIATPIVVALIALAAWFLVARSLRPVRSITEQAATINAGTLDARVPVPDTDDEISTLATTVNDMLDRIEHDDRRRRQFISDASHELRTPVAVIRNEAEIALAHPDAADTGLLANAVSAESNRLATIIDDLLAIARHDEQRSLPHADVDLDDIVLAEAARARRVPVDTSSVSAGRVTGNADELTRMVGHLLDNAARHAATQVRLTVTTVAAGEVDMSEVVLHVDDDGAGVAEADRSRIFDRFARLDVARTRDTGGAGLGLAVVAVVVEATGGSVDVTTAPIGGARFTVRLPAVAHDD